MGASRRPHTRDFENLAAFLAQQMAKTPIARLLRVRWDTVGRIVEPVVSDQLDERRLQGLVQIGVDEIAYRRGQRYLTTVCDHRTGAIVWMRPGRSAATLQAFFGELGERRHSNRAVSIDMSGGYAKAVREGLPGAEVCIDPFGVCQLAARAVDDVRRLEWNTRGKSKTKGGKWVKGVRWSLLKAPERQSVSQLAALGEVSLVNRRLFRRSCSKSSCACSTTSMTRRPSTSPPGSRGPRGRSFGRSSSSPARSAAPRGHPGRIRLGLSNGRLEGLNSRVRLISHRSFGFHSAAPLVALVYLCCGGLVVTPPLA